MSKGLEALKEVIKIYGETNSLEGTYNSFLRIKKELKALDIIKKKEVNVNTLINSIIGAIEPLEFYNEKVSENLKLTQQEYELLREVLYDE